MAIVPLFIPINEIDKYFYNRKEDIKKIEYYLNSLENNISQRLLIRGIRGVGKTFLLQKIKQDAKDNFIVSYLDVSQIGKNKEKQLSPQTVLLELLDEMNNSLYPKLKNHNKITFTLKKFLDNLKLNDYDFTEGIQIAQIPIPKSEENFNKISKFVMEYPQNVVENNDEIDGFIIIIDEFG